MALEKTEEELRNEISELLHQQREITQRLRDPRGLRRGGPFTALALRNGPRQRSFLSHGERNESEDQPPAKRRLSSTVVKVVEDGELLQDDDVAVKTNGIVTASHGDSRPFHPQNRTPRMDSDIPTAKHVPRVLPKNEDSRLVNRNKRMLGQLLGTLEKFQKEDMQLSGTEAYMRRSNSLQRAEQRAREESERLRIEEREQIAEKRKRDLTLRARVAAKTEEKKLELLFLQWSEHHKKLSNFIRTKAEPPIYYLPKKPLDDDDAGSSAKSREEAFVEWKNGRREELSEYQKQIGEQYLANVEKDMERWQNAKKAWKGNNNQDLQETMDKELDTHRLEHGPKKQKIPDGSNNEDDDVEDINVGEDDMMDDVLEDDSVRRVDETSVAEAGNSMADTPAHSDNVDLN